MDSGKAADPLALGAALVTVLLWASAYVGIRAAGQDFTAGPLTLYLVPPLTLVLGWVLLGGALCVAGVAVTRIGNPVAR
jgi:hypothetical protein